jgi:hypothetical protein
MLVARHSAPPNAAVTIRFAVFTIRSFNCYFDEAGRGNAFMGSIPTIRVIAIFHPGRVSPHAASQHRCPKIALQHVDVATHNVVTDFASGGAKFNQTVRKRLSLVGYREQAAATHCAFCSRSRLVATPWASSWFTSARVWPCVIAVSCPDGRHHRHDAKDAANLVYAVHIRCCICRPRPMFPSVDVIAMPWPRAVAITVVESVRPPSSRRDTDLILSDRMSLYKAEATHPRCACEG